VTTFAAARDAGHLSPDSQVNPQHIADDLDRFAQRLDELEKEIERATMILNDTEDAWLEVFDAVGESLRTEYQERGRKTDPAEHVIESEARRQNRLVWTNHRRAKRAVALLETQIRAVTAALSACQSRAKATAAESWR